MNKSLDKKSYQTIVRIVNMILKITLTGLKVIAVVLAIGLIAVVIIPKSNFEYNLESLQNIRINYMSIFYEINNSLFSGVVNMKWTLVFFLFIGLANLAFYIFLIFKLRLVIKDVKEQIPFSENNSLRFKQMGYAYLIAGVILPTLNSSFLLHMVDLLGIAQANVNFSLNFQSIFMGAIILILGYVFDYGSYLQEEHNMTV